MKVFRNSILLFIFALIAYGIPAQAQVVQDPTTWTYELKKISGDKYKAIFHVKLTAGWHIWSLKPGGDGLQIPPSFTFEPNKAVKTQGAVKESGKKITGVMDGVDGAVSRFENKVDYEQLLTVTANTTLKGKLEYQVCNEQMCLPPKKKPFSFEIKDAAKTTAADSPKTAAAAQPVADTAGQSMHMATTDAHAGSHTDTTANTATSTAPAANAKADAVKLKEQIPGSQSNLILLLEGIGAGIISVLTPCVFAMLPMTVSFFLKRSKDRKTGIKIALQYSLSIVLIFTAIGALFALFLKQDTLHAFSTNWIVNLIFALVFIVFGISFFGAFEITLPSSWATKMDTKANTRNFAGIFFMALTLVIVSFSCTGPFISFMLKLMDNGRKIGPLIGFLGYGVGLALPFALFAIFPSLLNTLGKQGGWLNVVKVTFGFIEVALALKFLSNADAQKGWRLLDREIFLAIWIALSFLLGGYLLGAFRFSHDSEMPKNDWGLPYLKVPRFLFAVSAFVFAIYMIPGMWGAPLKALGGLLPSYNTLDLPKSGAGNTSTAGAASTVGGQDSVRPVKFVDKMERFEPEVVVTNQMTVFFDYAEALAASKKLHKPVMIDFTGINCANCRKAEAELWSNAAVMPTLKRDFIIASLYCDANSVDLPKEDQYFAKSLDGNATTLGEKNQDLEISAFGANSLPTYFFVDEAGTKLYDKGTTYATSLADFIQALDIAKAKYKATHP